MDQLVFLLQTIGTNIREKAFSLVTTRWHCRSQRSNRRSKASWCFCICSYVRLLYLNVQPYLYLWTWDPKTTTGFWAFTAWTCPNKSGDQSCVVTCFAVKCKNNTQKSLGTPKMFIWRVLLVMPGSFHFFFVFWTLPLLAPTKSARFFAV